MTDPQPSLVRRARQFLFRSAVGSSADEEGNIFADYVVVFRYPVVGVSDASRAEHEANAVTAFRSFLSKLRSVRLKYEVRYGEKNSLLVFVLCPWERLKTELYRSRINDWLTGVRIADIDDTGSSSVITNALTESERLRLVHEIVTGAVEEGGAGVVPGVDPFVESLFPLHDEEFDKAWIHDWSTKWLIQEDDFLKIRNHYGEKIGFYFAFLQFYFLSLTPPSVLGFLVYLFGLNSYSITFSSLMVIWSIFFTSLWERRERELAVQWGTHHQSKTERRRAAFKGELVIDDPITGSKVSYVPVWKTWARRAASVPGIIVGAVGLSLVVSAVFTIEVFLKEYYRGPLHEILNFAPTIIYAALIPTLSSVYVSWSRMLNDWENHRTETDYESSLVSKIFITNFLTGYLSLFLIAWVYIPFGEAITPYLTLANIPHHHKPVGPERLKAQVAYFVIVGQVINFATEVVVPYLLRFAIGEAKEKITGEKVHTDSGADKAEEAAFLRRVRAEVALRNYDVYEDYAEMTVQFGYVSMFSTVLPLTPLFCMLNNLIELRSDAVKLCKHTRRPIPSRAESIGPWLDNLRLLTWLSSITTSSLAYLFSPTTDINSPYTPLFTLLAIFLGEHLFIVAQHTITNLFALLPSNADNTVRRQEYALKKRWLDRVAGAAELVDGSVVIESEKAQAGVAGFWEETEETEDEEEGVQLIRAAFKNK